MKRILFSSIFGSANLKIFCSLLLVISTAYTGQAQLFPSLPELNRDAPFQKVDVPPPVPNLTALCFPSIVDFSIHPDLQIYIPTGWKAISLESSIYNFKKPDENVVLLSDDQGSEVWIWKDTERVYSGGSPLQQIENDLMHYAPLHEHIKSFEVMCKDKLPVRLIVWRAYHIINGKKVAFTVFAGFKIRAPMDQNNAIRIFGRTPALDNSGKTENDIIKMAGHLNFIEEKKKKESDSDVIYIDTLVGQSINPHLTWDERVKTDAAKDSMIKVKVRVLQKMKWEFQRWHPWVNFDKKIKEPPVMWEVPTTCTQYIKLTDSRMVSPKHLVLFYGDVKVEMVDIQTGSLLWYNPHSDYRDCFFAEGNEERVVCCGKAPKTDYVTVIAYSTSSGEQQWSYTLPGETPTYWLPIEQEGILIAFQQKKDDETQITALNMKKGSKVWAKKCKHSSGLKLPPIAIEAAGNIITFFNGIEALSPGNGSNVWKNDDFLMDDESINTQVTSDTIIILDKRNALHLINIKTGTDLKTIKLNTTAEYTNIYPCGNRIYLRGRIKESKENDTFFIDALNLQSGETSWSYSDSVISISNIIDDGNRVYASTWKGPFALDRRTGTRFFSTELSEVGMTYPVSIRKSGDTIVYVGELVIAGVDSKTGKVLYRYDFDPVSQLMNVDALDLQLRRLTGFLSHFGTYGKQGLDLTAGGPGSKDYFRASTAAQERATALGKSSRNTFEREHQARIDAMNAESAKRTARDEALIGFVAFGLERAQASIKILIDPERDRMMEVKYNQKKLMKLNDQQDYADYAVRSMDKDESNGKVAIVYLPTGKIIKTLDSERIMKENIVINPEKNEIYYHELRQIPELENDFQMADGTKAHAYYLVAVPLVPGK